MSEFDMGSRPFNDDARQDEGRLRLLLDALPLLITYVDKGRRYQFNKKAHRNWFAPDQEDLQGRLVRDVLGEPAYEIMRPYIDGALAGKSADYEIRTPNIDGEERYIHATYVPDFELNGDVAGFFVVVDDISERKKAERALEEVRTILEQNVSQRTLQLQKTSDELEMETAERNQIEMQLRQMQKMEAIGQLTEGIAHDFNSVLGIAVGNLHLLQHQTQGQPELLRHVETALEGVERGVNITGKLLAISGQEAHDTKLTDLKKAIEGIRELIAKSLTTTVSAEIFLQDDLWPVDVNPSEFENALLNLCHNARDAMAGSGTLFIESANKRLDEGYARRNPPAKAGEFVMITVSDTGMGMTADTKEKLFNPFFTTKEFGQGSGLGLSMVHGFVERSGGYIEVYSELGSGTTFSIFLPRAAAQSTELKLVPRHQTLLPCGSETVLIVDDELDLLFIAVEYLKRLGYTTFTANDSRQALEILTDHPNINLMFSDIMMPGEMDGYQLSHRAKELYPELKILLTSGFTKRREEFTNDQDPYRAHLARSLLNKPYSDEELAFAVRHALDHD